MFNFPIQPHLFYFFKGCELHGVILFNQCFINFQFSQTEKTQFGVMSFSHLLHSLLINSCSVEANLLPPAVCINYAPV